MEQKNSKPKNQNQEDPNKLELVFDTKNNEIKYSQNKLNVDGTKKIEDKDVQSKSDYRSPGENKNTEHQDKGRKEEKEGEFKRSESEAEIKSNNTQDKEKEEQAGNSNTNRNRGANGIQNKNDSGDKRINNEASYTTDQASLDSLYKNEEQRRIYNIAAGSAMQDQLQSDLRAQRVVADSQLTSKTTLGIELTGATFIPSYNGTRKVVKSCPSLLKLVSTKTFGADKLPTTKSKHQIINEMPIMQSSRDLFSEGTDIIRVILETTNCNVNVTIDPQVQIKSSTSLFRNVLLAHPGTINAEYTTDTDTNIQHVFSAIFAYLPVLVPSCRVIYEMEPPFKPLLQMIGNDKLNITDDILNHIAIYKFPPTYGQHLILGAIDHGLEWFQDEISQMLLADPLQYVFGETRTLSELRMGRKREVESVEAIDQFAAALLHVDRTRRKAYKLDIRSYITWLHQFAIEGTQIDHLSGHDDADYEMEGITLADSHAFIFTYLTSKQFQTAMINNMVEYIVNFGLIKSISLSENLKINRGNTPSQTREQLVSEMQGELESVDVSTFVRMIVYDVMAVFVPVRYTIRATMTDELENFPKFLMNLMCIVICPNIFAQNKHIIGFNICNFLFNIEYQPYMQFQNQHGFSSTKSVPDLIDDDFYKNGEIPKIFDESIKTRNQFINRIRQLLKVEGETFTLKNQSTLKMPRLEDKPQGYIPYKRIERSAGYSNTPMQAKLWEILRLVNDVGNSYLKVTTSARRTTISDFILWVTSLKPLMKEFSAMIHYEGYFMYKLILQHYACLWTDIKSPNDYNVTEKLRLAIQGDSQNDMEPFLIEREPIKIPFTLPLSCVLTIEGIYSVINRHKENDVRISVPNPQVVFKEFYSICKGTRQMCEVLAMSRHILRDDGTGIVKNLAKFAQVASEKVVYKEVLRMMAKYQKNMPSDFLEYAEQSITYTNQLQFWDPYVVFVNKINEIQHLDSEPELMKRSLLMSDEFLAQEVDIISDLLFNNSFLFHINCGIRIFKQKVDFLQPGLPPKRWETYRVKVTGNNNLILRESYILGRNRLVFALYNPEINEEVTYEDLTPCNMPRVLFECEHPVQISSKYRSKILELIDQGVFGFHFTQFWYQATTYYSNEAPSSYPNTYISDIMSTVDDTLKLILFPDTSGKIVSNNGKVEATPYQYYWTGEDIQTDILMRDISGSRANPIAYSRPNPENWMLGKKGASVMPKFSNGISKTKSSIPNFLNTVVAHRAETVNYTFPPVEITAPKSLLS